MKQIRYVHPAFSIVYSTNKTYNFEDVKQVLTLKQIETMFEPIGFEWSDLEVKHSNNNKLKVNAKAKETQTE